LIVLLLCTTMAKAMLYILSSALLISPVFSTTERLTIVNGCGDEPIWIASSSNVPDQRNMKLMPGGKHTYNIPQDLHSTRFWPKMRCNASGQECKIGNSGGPGQACGAEGCAPPVDSKFEASFGHQGSNCHADASVCDWWDTSGVDGFTLPYKVELSDHCKTNGYKGVDIDCSELSVAQCPIDESITGVGNTDLRLRYPGTGDVVGCYSPCAVLTSSQWSNPLGNHSPADAIANPFCCPTPPVSSEQCRTGPANKTQYSNAVHKYCPGVYSYAYDDKTGLQVCPAETMYTWTLFCPGQTPPAPSPPAPLPPSPPNPPTPSGWSKCTTGPCCNPHSAIPEVCPGGQKCAECGGGDACQCPSAITIV